MSRRYIPTDIFSIVIRRNIIRVNVVVPDRVSKFNKIRVNLEESSAENRIIEVKQCGLTTVREGERRRVMRKGEIETGRAIRDAASIIITRAV